MSEPTSTPDPTPAVPPAPSFTYGTPEPAAPVAPPLPTYGEQVPGYAAAGVAPVYGAMPVVKTRRTWDLVLTIILLVVGLFGMLLGVFYGWIFLHPDLLVQTLQRQGYNIGSADTSSAGVALILSHVVLYLIAAGVGIFLIIRKTLAFWVPLAIGVIAAIVFWGIVLTTIVNLPGFSTIGR
ncbi:MAG: DUF6264 family protein [Pseudolysinimonas sp.]|uniref:DUF6264 family protein n=1 Tax=Pseudolysinimonas sp. TaxID=2680009 RepID=UPI003265EB91